MQAMKMTDQITRHGNAGRLYFDATFKVVPALYYQLMILFVPYVDAAFPVFYALMSRKTEALLRKITRHAKCLATTVHCIIRHGRLWGDTCPHFDEFSAQRQCQRLLVSLRAIDHQTSAEIRTKGRVCDWGNSRSPRLIGAIVYRSPWVTVEDAVRCLLGLPLLPVDIRPALVDVKETLADNNAFTSNARSHSPYAVHFLLIDFFIQQYNVLFTVVY